MLLDPEKNKIIDGVLYTPIADVTYLVSFLDRCQKELQEAQKVNEYALKLQKDIEVLKVQNFRLIDKLRHQDYDYREN